ncbi:recombinase family protein [Actinomadura sp. 21ATH]|uniref:recombinase family protein n=1 Tax=Actinomadura sp. 21ATH TaxID=1735444 RepID=UPI0035C090F5
MQLRSAGRYRPKEAAALLGVSPKTLDRWEQAGRLTAVRTAGGHRRYPVEDVHRLMHVERRGACYQIILGCSLRDSAATALTSVVHHHFGGDGAAALTELAALFALTVIVVEPEPSGES